VGVGRDFAKDATTMLVIFSGAWAESGPPPFEFTALTSQMPVKRLFVRDVQGVWYHKGVPGFGGTVDEVRESLRLVLGDHEIERLVVMGNSRGGYAALLFGTLLQADLVLAFAPQTVIDREWLSTIGDDRWDHSLDLLERHGGPDRRYVDLAEALPRDGRGKTEYRIHYNAASPADESHALRLRGLPNLELVAHDAGGRAVVRWLRVNEKLMPIFRTALDIGTTSGDR
jgi:hypothetical protein